MIRSVSRVVILAAACAALPLSSVGASGLSATHTTHGKVASKKAHRPLKVTIPKGWPQKVLIPKLSVAAPVEALDLSKHLPQAAPFRWGDVAWYDRGPKPGDVGHAAVFGHVDSTCCPAVFWKLNQLKAGDIVEAKYKSGNPVKFKVMWSESYANTKMPIKFLFGRSSQRAMVLVTCAGVFRGPAKGGYDHKLVVYARMILPNGQLG